MAASRVEGKIKPIDRAAVHRICSGQVVLDLATAVKELVENSLDAGATSIEIRLKDYGAELIEVADNGTGVSSENYQGLTLKYHTSKISQFADLQSLSSFGFRGEALSSLCALAKVSVVTRTKNELVAVRLEYDHSGLIVSQESTARSIGTTVSVSKLFSPLPVRFKEFSRNVRREYGRLLSVLQAYALIAKGVRLICSNQTGRAGRTVVVQTQGNTSMRDNIVTVFGTKTAACMEKLELSVSDTCKVEGFISKPGAGCGRASGDRQFFFVNGRPVDMPKVAKLLNELYRSFNSLQYPMLVLNFVMPTTAYDVNVTPDKRKLFLHAEGELMAALRESLEKMYAPSKYTYTLNNLESRPLSKIQASSKIGGVVNNIRSDTLQGDPVVDHDTSSDEDLEEESREGAMASELKDAGESDRARPSLNDFSFQHKINKMMKDKRLEGTSGTGAVHSVPPERSFLNLLSDRKMESKFTACVSRSRKSLEASCSDLLSEEPLLKKWRISSPMEKMMNADNRGCLDKSVDSESRVPSPRDNSGLQKNSNTQNPTVTIEDCCLLTGLGADGSGAALASENSIQIDDADVEDVAFKKPAIDCDESSMFKSGVTEIGQMRANWPEQEAKLPLPGPKPYLQKKKGPTDMLLKDSSITHMKTMGFSDSGQRLSSKSALRAGAGMGGGNLGSELKDAGHQQKDCGRVTESVGTSGRDFSEAEEGKSKVSVDRVAVKVDNVKVVAQNKELGKSREARPVVEFDMDKLCKKAHLGLLQGQTNGNRSQKQKPSRRKSSFTAATLSGIGKEGAEKDAVLEAATLELERSFNKADFKKMKVLGQFNLGFILAKIDQDIFIIDQHASDEKYNFERLSKTTVLNRQPLLRPLPLELSAAEEITVLSHMETFRLNGFDFFDNEDAPAGRRLQLSAVPFSQNVTFGVGDVQELISLLANEPFTVDCATSDHSSLHSKVPRKTSSWLPRPSRVRAMLASRACRSSVMIGDPLSTKEMERILSHLAELDAPWNCPHGRPTMRHLVDLTSIKR